MKIRMAELNVEIHNRYPYLERLCEGYHADFEQADIVVEISPEEIAKEVSEAQTPTPPTPGYAEAICVYRSIAQQLPHFSAFVFHAAVIEHEGRGYAFSAKSGTGKSTHISLWKEVFGDGVCVINGDKPILRFLDGKLWAFGTPWCGKERMQANKGTPLTALCFIERGKENAIAPIDNAVAVQRLFFQILMPSDRAAALLFLDLLDRTVRELPTYLLSCNMEPEAALVAYRGMNKGEDQ